MSTITRTSVLSQYIDQLLAGITIAGGYQTDIGLRHFRGRRNLDGSSAPCVSLIEGPDEPQDQGAGREQVVIRQHYAISAHVPCDPDNPNDAANDAVEDIRHALFRQGVTLGGAIKKLDYNGREIGTRADGEATVQVVVHVSALMAQDLVRS